MDYENERDLIERAMAGVRVVICATCAGHRTLPQGLHIICPHCKGAGEIVQTGEPAHD